MDGKQRSGKSRIPGGGDPAVMLQRRICRGHPATNDVHEQRVGQRAQDEVRPRSVCSGFVDEKVAAGQQRGHGRGGRLDDDRRRESAKERMARFGETESAADQLRRWFDVTHAKTVTLRRRIAVDPARPERCDVWIAAHAMAMAGCDHHDVAVLEDKRLSVVTVGQEAALSPDDMEDHSVSFQELQCPVAAQRRSALHHRPDLDPLEE